MRSGSPDLQVESVLQLGLGPPPGPQHQGEDHVCCLEIWCSRPSRLEVVSASGCPLATSQGSTSASLASARAPWPFSFGGLWGGLWNL